MTLNKDNIRKILLILGSGILLYWAIHHTDSVLAFCRGLLAVLAPILIGLSMAFIINVLLNPVERIWDRLPARKLSRLKRRLKRPLCLLISTLVIGGVIFIILFMVVPEIRKTGALLLDMIPQYILQLEQWWTELAVFLSDFAIVLPRPELSSGEIAEMAAGFLGAQGHSFVGRTLHITTSIFSGIFNVVLGLVFAFYILSRKETLGRHMRKLLYAYLPKARADRALELTVLTRRTFTNFVSGQLMESVIIGVLCFLGMALFRMPYAPMISVLVGFTALIPVFGAFIGTAVGALLILMTDPSKAFLFVVFIIVLQQLEGDIIYPRVVGRSVGLPGIWVLATVTLGGSIFGIAGMLLSVPISSVLYTVLSESVDKRLKEKDLEIL